MLSPSEIRERTRKQLELLGYRFNPSLPVLDPIEIHRSTDDVARRILALYASVACSYGFSKESALQWLDQESLAGALSETEDLYLHTKNEERGAAIQWQVESLWALTWCAGYHEQLDFSESCPDSFIGMFPDLKVSASSRAFAQRCRLRGDEDIAEMVDLTYCLHWAVRDERLTGIPSRPNGDVLGQAVEERRRGLEWLIGVEEWDDVSLDT